MRAEGISPNLMRVLAGVAPDVLADLFRAGRTLDAEVISVFQDRAMLAFGTWIRLEVQLQAELEEGERVKVQVQPREPGEGIVLKLVQQPPLPVSPEPLTERWQSGSARAPVHPHQVRLWWETPGLGELVVTLEAHGHALAACFTVQAADVRPRVVQAFADLEERLAQLGFTEVRLDCHPPRPLPGGARLDRRL